MLLIYGEEKAYLGIDCSGFTQVVFHFVEFIPRDAYQQAKQLGKKIAN
jgi:cell wall-associated NlpC family hydrolase